MENNIKMNEKKIWLCITAFLIIVIGTVIYANSTNQPMHNDTINCLEYINIIVSMITYISMAVLAYFTFKSNFLLKDPLIIIDDKQCYTDMIDGTNEDVTIRIINIGKEIALNIKLFF